MASISQTIQKMALSASNAGSPIMIDSSTQTEPTPLHEMDLGTDSYVDSIWIEAHNESNDDVEIALIWNPTSGSASGAAAAETFWTIPARDNRWIARGRIALPGLLDPPNDLHGITAYVPVAGDVDKVKITGFVERIPQEGV